MANQPMLMVFCLHAGTSHLTSIMMCKFFLVAFLLLGANVVIQAQGESYMYWCGIKGIRMG